MKPDTAENVTAFHKYLKSVDKHDPESNWVLVARGHVQGAFGTYEAAFQKGIKDFSETAFLIREAVAEAQIVPFVFTEA